MKKFVKSCFLLTVMLAASANALVVSDYIDIKTHNNGYLLLSEGDSYTVTHDLTGYGVPAPNQVNSAWLRLSFADDEWWDWWFETEDETALVSGSGINGDFEVGGSIFWYDIRYLGVGQEGLDDLNLDGLIEVTVTALELDDEGRGDFYWKTSELFADISPVSVNEPATLVMLGIGLLGLGIVRRRKDS